MATVFGSALIGGLLRCRGHKSVKLLHRQVWRYENRPAWAAGKTAQWINMPPLTSSVMPVQ
jgi:hypothetical protein